MSVRPQIRLNEDGSLDEVVANGAYFHLERLSDGAWWMCVEAGGNRVDVTLYTRRKALILANVDDCEVNALNFPSQDALRSLAAARVGDELNKEPTP